MATKVYTSGNYFYLKLEGVTEPLMDSKSNVTVWKSKESTDEYIIQGPQLGRHILLLSDLVDGNDTHFTALSWKTFYEVNSGFSRASGSEVGWFDYNDANTPANPISVTGGAGYVDLTNDGLGEFTNKDFTPSGVVDIYDTENNRFYYNDLKLGDTIEIRLDLEVTTSSVNTEIKVVLLQADGGFSYTTPFVSGRTYKSVGVYNVNEFNGVYMGDSNTLNNFAKFQISADKNCSVIVRGWYCKITRV